MSPNHIFQVANNHSVVLLSVSNIHLLPLLIALQYAREGNASALKVALGPLGNRQFHKRVNAKDEDKLTALHYAARYSHMECCQLLVERGASESEFV